MWLIWACVMENEPQASSLPHHQTIVEGRKTGRPDGRPQKGKLVATISQASFKAAGPDLKPGQRITDTLLGVC